MPAACRDWKPSARGPAAQHDKEALNVEPAGFKLEENLFGSLSGVKANTHLVRC